ncbi:protein turtle homolog A [Takifugu rubripes]|uniref:Immunoglobulin superfamily, member 9a n=1 Tax=Takifugu rubripes TaxID=31033 RepID=H2SEQ0_TAKRU|nr:protein turtle homolog A-like [Takifugu rubripes]
MGSRGSTFTAAAAFCLFWLCGALRPEVRGKVGGAAELPCNFPSSQPAGNVSSAPLRVVEWVRRGLDSPVLMKFGSYKPRVHPDYEGRVYLVQTTALRLEALQLDDQGLYECRILLLDEPTDELQNGTWTQLSVTAPPTFTQAPPPAQEALVGSHLSLVCVAHGNPSPTITWLKDGRVIQGTNNQDGVLSLHAVSAQTAGQYTCHASNSEGNVTRVTKVKIKGPPVIVVPPRSMSVNVSQDALLQCQAYADPPNMTYVWRKNGENVYHAESLKSRVKIMVDGTLLISSLIPEDSGNYTCMPTNGLLIPPTASANLTVMHPAQALQMPAQTYLPTGMEGVITCPAASQPPLIRVDWTKDGEPLDLSTYPGWTLTSAGSLLMATVNDDASGVYACTPYNSYGTAGASGPTDVILKDPPSFSITPETQYREETGRSLLIPCQGKHEDPTIKVTWSKVDLALRTSYSILANGSLLLQPLTKDHQGAWECTVTNQVAAVRTSTSVFVLGTSPHAATSLSVSPGVKQANISWEAGFDGGSAQTFSVWVKKISASDNDGKQGWFSVSVPPKAGTKMHVANLSSNTGYQFSILSQNKMGTGPFSVIVTARTLGSPLRRGRLKPPASLSANQSSAGIILQWSLPEVQNPQVTAFVLQSRTEQGEWFNLDENIGANRSEIVVPGLHKDRAYELRLLSRCGELLSEPSPSVNVSTIGMDSYPVSSQLLENVPEPLMAGVLGGVGFMGLALALLLGSACVVSRKMGRRCKREEDEPPPAIYKRSPSIKTSGSGSPDSVLKKSLLPPSSLCPTTSSSTSSPSSSQADCSSLGSESHHWMKHLSTSKSCLSKATSYPVSSSIELISRGSDGRFLIPPYKNDTPGPRSKKHCDQLEGGRRSVSLRSERLEKKEPPFVLSVELPPCDLTEALPSSQFCSTAQHLPPREPFGTESNAGDDRFPDLSSVCSNGSLATFPAKDRKHTLTFPVLPHIRRGLGQPATNASALVLQMEHEREKGNLNHCLKLAQEREELEKELKRYTLERSSTTQQHLGGERQGRRDSENLWEYRSRTLPHRYPQGNKQRSALSSSNFSTPSLGWEAPASNLSCANMSLSPAMSSDTERQLHCGEGGGKSIDRWTLPYQPSKKHKKEVAGPKGCDGSPESSPSHCSISTLSFHSNRYTERSNSALSAVAHASGVKELFPSASDEKVSVEMSVDEPQLEESIVIPSRLMLHHRIASHLQHGHSPASGSWFEDQGDPIFGGSSIRSTPPDPRLELSRVRSSKIWESALLSRSLDMRTQKEEQFLTPDAWIYSLSQENCSALSPDRTSSLFLEKRVLPSRTVLKSPNNCPSTSQPPQESSDRLSLKNNTFLNSGCKINECGHQEVVAETQGSSEVLKDPPACVHDDKHPDALEIEAGSYEGVPQSGSYSSYASSGRGSMGPANGLLSVCHLPPSLTIFPETVEGSQRRTHDDAPHRRKASVDENYEWDAADFCSQPGDYEGELPSSDLLKPSQRRRLPSMQHSTNTLRNCTRLPSHAGHPGSCSAGPEPEAVLF